MQNLRILYLSIFLFFSTIVIGQDIHFSQFYATPLVNNPAFTGYFAEDYRLSGTFRTQWEGFGGGFGNAYRSTIGSGELSLLKNKREGSALGVGLTAINDRAGDLALTTNQINVSLSYIQSLDATGNNFISVGFMGGYVRRGIDLSKANFGDSYNPGTNEFDGGSDEVFGNIIPKSGFGNLSVGMLWFTTPTSRVNLYAGFAMHNLLKPNVSFFVDTEESLFYRYSGQFGASIKAGKNVDIIPSMIYQKQGPNQEITFGSFVKYRLGMDDRDNTGIQFGAWYRFGDALIPAFRYDKKTISMIFSYDVNLSSLTKASRLNGGPELTFIYGGKIFEEKKGKSSLKCPVL